MAYCAYCGKQLPEGALCDCPDAQTLMLAVQQAMKAQQAAAPAPKTKKKAHLFIPLTALLLITVIAAGVGGYFLYPALNEQSDSKSSRSSKSTQSYLLDPDGSGSANAARYIPEQKSDVENSSTVSEPASEPVQPADDNDTAQAMSTYSLSDFVATDEYQQQLADYYACSYDKNGAEDFYSYIYPSGLVDELRADGTFSELVSERNSSISALVDSGTTARLVRIVSSDVLTDDELDTIGEHFSDVYSGFGVKAKKISVSDGAQLEAEYVYDYANGTKTYRTASACVVYIDGDGWKVIPLSISSMQ